MHLDPRPLNPVGLIVFLAAAIGCLVLALALRRGAPLPGGWRETRFQGTSPGHGRAESGKTAHPDEVGRDRIAGCRADSRRFLFRFLVGVALFAALVPFLVRHLPWKTAALVLTGAGAAALAAAGAGVRHFRFREDALTDPAGERDNRNR